MIRRSFLKALVAVPFAACVAPRAFKPAPRTPQPMVPKFKDQYSDIIATTIESRSRRIADNVSRNNQLFALLENRIEEAERALTLNISEGLFSSKWQNWNTPREVGHRTRQRIVSRWLLPRPVSRFPFLNGART